MKREKGPGRKREMDKGKRKLHGFEFEVKRQTGPAVVGLQAATSSRVWSISRWRVRTHGASRQPGL